MATASEIAQCQEWFDQQLRSSVGFWMKHSIDQKHGWNDKYIKHSYVLPVINFSSFAGGPACRGYYNCLAKNGEIFDTTKHGWLQGRQVESVLIGEVLVLLSFASTVCFECFRCGCWPSCTTKSPNIANQTSFRLQWTVRYKRALTHTFLSQLAITLVCVYHFRRRGVSVGQNQGKRRAEVLLRSQRGGTSSTNAEEALHGVLLRHCAHWTVPSNWQRKVSCKEVNSS